MLHRLALKLDLFYASRMEIRGYLLEECLDQDYEPRHLDTATGTAGTGSYEHKHDKYGLRGDRPGIKVGTCKARRRDDRAHLKEGLPYSIRNRIIHGREIKCYDTRRNQNDYQVSPRLFMLCRIRESLYREQRLFTLSVV